MNISTRKLALISTLLLLLSSCATQAPFKAYLGAPLQDMQLSTVQGRTFVRTELLNRYIDTIRFMEVDGIPVTNSERHSAIQITPGYHDIRVYFSWDIGSLRGMAPAMVDFARTRDHISRTLRFNARAGESYTVLADVHFDDDRHDITTLSHVDFWVVNEDGAEIVSREAGRYNPQ